MKAAWINREKRIIAFRFVDGFDYYEAEEAEFWDYVKMLVSKGYRLQ